MIKKITLLFLLLTCALVSIAGDGLDEDGYQLPPNVWFSIDYSFQYKHYIEYFEDAMVFGSSDYDNIADRRGFHGLEFTGEYQRKDKFTYQLEFFVGGMYKEFQSFKTLFTETRLSASWKFINFNSQREVKVKYLIGTSGYGNYKVNYYEQVREPSVKKRAFHVNAGLQHNSFQTSLYSGIYYSYRVFAKVHSDYGTHWRINYIKLGADLILPFATTELLRELPLYNDNPSNFGTMFYFHSNYSKIFNFRVEYGMMFCGDETKYIGGVNLGIILPFNDNKI